MKLEGTGYPDCKRIVDEDGKVLVMLNRYTDGAWRLHDVVTDAKVSNIAFMKPKNALKYWVALSEGKTQ